MSSGVERDPDWLALGRELHSIAQAGLTYARDAFDQQRYTRLRELAADVMAGGSLFPRAPLRALLAMESGYLTPKVDVRAAVFREGRILMVREASDGGWTLPGGWADVNQSASECCEREVAEESGFLVRASKLAAVWDYRRQGHQPLHPASIYKLFFLCELVGGAARCSEETTDVQFFAPDALPALSGGRITQRQIARMFEHAAAPGLATDFD